MDDLQVQQTINWLYSIRDEVLNLADLKEGQTIADFGCGTGLLAFGVLERLEDKAEIIFSDKFSDCLEDCKKILQESTKSSINKKQELSAGEVRESAIDKSPCATDKSSCATDKLPCATAKLPCDVVKSSCDNVKSPYNVSFLQNDICAIELPDNYLDRALTRSVLVHVLDKPRAFYEIYRVLKPEGLYCAFEPIISSNTKYYELLLPNQITDYFEFQKAEKEFSSNPNDPLVNFSAQSLDKDMLEAGFSDVLVDVKITASKYIAKKENIINWFTSPPAPDQKTVKERFLDYFEEKKVDRFISEVTEALGDREVKVKSQTALIKAKK